MKNQNDQVTRFGIGEWYGYDITKISADERKLLAVEALKTKPQRSQMLCPFQPGEERTLCSKPGGVCSLRLYEEGQSGSAKKVGGVAGQLRTTCPKRFNQGWVAQKHVGNIILKDSEPLMTSEFALAWSGSRAKGRTDGASRFDAILATWLTMEGFEEKWVALEVKSTYFSGDSMKREFEAIRDGKGKRLKFPVGNRHPDYKSSCDKRLLLQLQEKVTAIRRWGKKVAIVVDRPFFTSLGQIETVSDVSNADIAWVVVGYKPGPGAGSMIAVEETRYTTLEKMVEALTVKQPASRTEFEGRLRAGFADAIKCTG